MTACIPAGKILPCVALIPSVFVKIRIRAAAVSIRISIKEGIPRVVSPKVGRRLGIEPKRTIRKVAAKNNPTESCALNLFSTLFNSTCLSFNIPLCIRRWYSGSSTSSLPTFMEKNAPTSTPIKVAGTQIFKISNKVMSKPANKPKSATVAAEIGLAVIPCWEAITAIPNGRSGRILVSVATSAITGSTEYATCPVPAKKVKK